MNNLIKGEFFKFIKNKGIKLTIILVLISSAVFFLLLSNFYAKKA